ncbi:MAG TPA: cupin domain-containing protein [Xanthobacteraceae bacterium]|jgi:quercetin dioxygenase-like cupin family protein|nr:cupin domain-containing protein [Xanthobacteraceae bacterium]
MLRRSIVVAAVALAAALVPATAQQSNIKRTMLQTVEFPPGFTTVSALVEVAPRGCAGSHTHPGVESTYVMEGEVVLKLDGEPDRVLKAGDSFQIPPGVVHDACVTNGSPVKLLATFVVEKGKALATPNPFLKAR